MIPLRGASAPHTSRRVAGSLADTRQKRTSTPTELTYHEAVEEALAHGWIDGLARRCDEMTFSLRFTPRRKRSPWSRRNVAIATRGSG